MKHENEEYDKAFEVLKEKLGTNEALNLIHPIVDFWRKQFPYIGVASYDKGKPKVYESRLEGFPSWGFNTELELNLANALFLLYKSTGQEFSRERFQTVFQLVLELLNVESDWRMK